MDLKLQTTTPNITKDCSLFHDINGNLIAKITKTNENNKIKNKIYRLDINKYDKLEFTRIKNMDSMFPVINGMISYNKIQNIKNHSLKKKIMNSLDSENHCDYEEELEDDEQFLYERTLLTHLPEMRNYYTTSNNSDDDMLNYNEDDIIFKFNNNDNDDIKLPQYHKTFDSPSLYDLIVKNNNMIVFTSEAIPYSSYIVLINGNDNIFELNVVGTSITQYELKYIDKNLTFNEIICDAVDSD